MRLTLTEREVLSLRVAIRTADGAFAAILGMATTKESRRQVMDLAIDLGNIERKLSA